MFIRWYTFYLFDNVPLVVEDYLGYEFHIRPMYSIGDVDVEEFAYNEWSNCVDQDYYDDVCAVIARWNTNKWTWCLLEGTFIR